MNSMFTVGAATAGLLLQASAASAAVMTYQEDAGGYEHVAAELRETSAAPYYPDGPGFNVGYYDLTTKRMRAVMGFDLTGIPNGSVITSVTLDMVVDHTGGTVPAVNMHAINHATATVDEAEVSWTEIQSGTSWASAGGDYDATVLSSISGWASGVTSVQFASTAALVSAVQASLDGGTPFEFILIAPDAEASNSLNYVYFQSDDHVDPNRHPVLTVGYTAVPEPVSLSLLTLGGLLLFKRR